MTCLRVGAKMAGIHIAQREDSVAFRVEQIDHVELYVPDQYEAARWYKDVLGFEVLPAYEHWVSEGGPLIISCDGGPSKLALFKGEVRSSDRTSWYRRVAFRVTGQGFIEFLRRLDSQPVYEDGGKQVRAKDSVDHGKVFSIYFCDPYGHPLEVCTYDYQHIFQFLHAGED